MGQGFEENFTQAHGDLPTAHDGARVAGVEDQPLRSDHLDRLVEALVDRDVRIHQALQDIDAGGEGLGEVAVHGGRPLRVRPPEVESDFAALHSDLGLQVHGTVRDAVVIEPALRFVGPLRQFLQFPFDSPRRVLQQPVDVEVEGLFSVSIQKRRQPPHSHVVGRDLGPEVAAHFPVGPHVGQDHLPEARMDLSARDQLHHGENDALLVDLPKRSNAGGSPAPHVHVVTAVAHVAHQLPPMEKRSDEKNVVQVATLPVGVVDHQHVPRLQILAAVFLNRARDQTADGDQMRRLAEGLRHHPALRIHEGAGIVEPGLDVGGEGGSLNGDRHFLGHLHQSVSNHFEENRIDLAVSGCYGFHGLTLFSGCGSGLTRRRSICSGGKTAPRPQGSGPAFLRLKHPSR